MSYIATKGEEKRRHAYRIKTDQKSPWFVVILDKAHGNVEADLPAIKESLVRRYGRPTKPGTPYPPSYATTSFTAVEYLGAEESFCE